MLRERQENMDKQFNDIRKLYNKNEMSYKRDTKHKSNEIGNLELNTMTELKRSTQSFNSRPDKQHSIRSEYTEIKITQSETKGETMRWK